MRPSSILNIVLVGLAAILPASAQTSQNASSFGPQGTSPNQRFELSQAQAMQILTAASAKAASIPARENIAIVTPDGFLLAFTRNDNAFLASIEVAIKKARTVAIFNGGRTSEALQALVQPGAALYGIEQTNGGLVAFGGGLPVYIRGAFVGAVGVSGGTTAQDIEVATAGILAVGNTTQVV